MVNKRLIDAGTLKSLRMVYTPGMQVKAIAVGDVATGTTGIVREVLDNGDISVLWNTGYVTDVVFGMDSIGAVSEGKCILQRNPGYGVCDRKECHFCGWNVTVSDKRKRMIAAGLMVRNKEGLLTLKVMRADAGSRAAK